MGLNRGDYYDRTRLALVLIHGCEQVADHCIELEVVMFMRRSYAQAGVAARPPPPYEITHDLDQPGCCPGAD